MVSAASLASETITDLSGNSRPVRHPSDLPMDCIVRHPDLPRDLPVPVGALSLVPNHGRIGPLCNCCNIAVTLTVVKTCCGLLSSLDGHRRFVVTQHFFTYCLAAKVDG